ncbi:MAG: hypothetical protein D3913_16120 [Candidatus Electrothrix sp. LOE1_4_5]|nr:hypothetical protein [Candidatus Electrothrix gigas]
MNTLLANINNPVVVYIILVVVGLYWLLPKSKDVAAWKELFSKDRAEELKKVREELKDVPEEVAFYDEAVREELFHTATQIRCGKKQRRMYQKLVTDGVASVEGIRRAWIYIYENNSRVEIKFLCIEKIMAGFLILFTLFGILAIYASLVNIESLFDLSKYPNTLFIFSSGILFISSSLHQLLPVLIRPGHPQETEGRGGCPFFFISYR